MEKVCKIQVKEGKSNQSKQICSDKKPAEKRIERFKGIQKE